MEKADNKDRRNKLVEFRKSRSTENKQHVRI